MSTPLHQGCGLPKTAPPALVRVVDMEEEFEGSAPFDLERLRDYLRSLRESYAAASSRPRAQGRAGAAGAHWLQRQAD
jgi:phytoene dehydrogenase-like protein